MAMMMVNMTKINTSKQKNRGTITIEQFAKA